MRTTIKVSKRNKNKTKSVSEEKKHIRPEKIKCDICPKVCYSEFNMKAHIMFEHKNVTGCDQCDTKFTTPRTLADHLRGHDKKYCHICDICGVSIKQHSKLAEHMRVHTGERPFPCTLCNYSGAQASSLKVKKFHKLKQI